MIVFIRVFNLRRLMSLSQLANTLNLHGQALKPKQKHDGGVSVSVSQCGFHCSSAFLTFTFFFARGANFILLLNALMASFLTCKDKEKNLHRNSSDKINAVFGQILIPKRQNLYVFRRNLRLFRALVSLSVVGGTHAEVLAEAVAEVSATAEAAVGSYLHNVQVGLFHE